MEMADSDCPFCNVDEDRVIARTSVALVIYDAFPVSRGHALVLPRQHVGCVYELPDEEQAELWRLAGEVQKLLEREFSPDGFNIGINDGEAAGQTVDHAHIHIIPRYTGDVNDPRGGIRWVLPDTAQYWED